MDDPDRAVVSTNPKRALERGRISPGRPPGLARRKPLFTGLAAVGLEYLSVPPSIANPSASRGIEIHRNYFDVRGPCGPRPQV